MCVCVFLSLYSPIHGSALAKCKELEVQRQSCITFVAGTCFIGLGNFNEGVCVRCIYWVWRRKGSGKEKRTTRMYMYMHIAFFLHAATHSYLTIGSVKLISH